MKCRVKQVENFFNYFILIITDNIYIVLLNDTLQDNIRKHHQTNCWSHFHVCFLPLFYFSNRLSEVNSLYRACFWQSVCADSEVKAFAFSQDNLYEK